LINCIQSTYKETAERLETLLANRMITYDLLWILFKPGQKICATCRGTGKPRSLTYDFGEERRTQQGMEYFELTGRYFDFDGRVFGEVEDKIQLMKFRGALLISKLAAFPLEYHPTRETMELHLRECGLRFVDMMATHHCYYQGVAFFEQKDRTIRQVPVDGRVIVDAYMFQKVNPCYPKLQDRISVLDMWRGTSSDEFTERVKCSGKHPGELSDDDLLVCTPTVLGFSLGDKFWGKIRHQPFEQNTDSIYR
jgi:hypothetical protein